jgi:hypothetical protein
LSKKLFQRVIASGNHLLTQVKGNQPNLRSKLEIGASWRKPLGCAISQAQGHNRWEKRELTAFPAPAITSATSPSPKTPPAFAKAPTLSPDCDPSPTTSSALQASITSKTHASALRSTSQPPSNSPLSIEN